MTVKSALMPLAKSEQEHAPATTEAAEIDFRPGWFAALLALIVIVTFASVLSGRQTFVFRDFGVFSYPVASFQRESFWRGELPHWNPLNYCGLPFLAQWNTMALYPPSLLYMFFPLSWSLPFFCILHLFWGGLGMYFLSRQLTGHSLAAAVAGVAFAFSGLTLSFLMWQSHEATFSWLPWVLWLGQRGWREGGKKLAWGTVAASMQMLAGGPETILFTWVILFLLACGDWIRKEAARWQVACRFFGMGILVALICAAQLLPFLQLLSHSQRDSGFGSNGWSMPIWGWANLLVPLFRTTSNAQGVCMQEGQYLFSSYYFGVGVLLLTLITIYYAKDWRARLAAALVVIGLILALGDRGILYHVLRVCVPAIGFARYPVKFMILVCALAPLAGAFGLASLWRNPGKSRRFAWSCVALLLLLITVIMLLEPRVSEQMWRATWQNGVQRAVILIFTLLIAELCVRSKGRQQLYGGVLLVLVVWLDFLTHMPPQNPTVSPIVYSPNWVEGVRHWTAKPEFGESRAMVTRSPEQAFNLHAMKSLEDNYLLQRVGLFSDCNLVDNVPQVHGFFSLMPGEINFAIFSLYEHTNLDFSPFLDFIGVSQILNSAETLEWVHRPSAMPLVTVGQQPVFAEDKEALRGYVATNTDFRRMVFLPPEARGEIKAEAQPTATANSPQFSAQQISFSVSSPSPTMAVIAQTYYPAWRAYVDGKPVKLWRANYAFQSLEVPPGRHEVTVKYEDRAFQVGVLFSGIGCLLCLGVWGRDRLRKPVFPVGTG